MTDTRQLSTPLDVTDDLTFSGQANGGGVVRSGARLHLSGQMYGRLTVENGAHAHLSGQLNGTAEVLGTLDVTGQISGVLQVADSGQLMFATGSSIVRSGRTLVVNESGEFQPPQKDGSFYVISDETPRWLYQYDGTLILAQK
ncbi:hypothetical protein RCH21_002809 [Arthrobacter sp. PL16]|uniref:hypothetical protein n=1 Tax=Arthrobacter sp. PL16 TaxID=3071720 RepID=UPI002E03A830|nr:hypothetical protein [Arthrobacter sp. PL16]